jgi:hypothetical protein
MSAPQLTWRDISRRLHADEASLEPSPDLWPRIVAAHAQRARSARRRRLAGAVAGVVVLVAAAAALSGAGRPAPGIDWQARAQALELQLRALHAEEPARGAAPAAQSELAALDRVLQAAYDEGADAARLDALWKRRSELLDTLLRVRRENIEISRI